MAYDFRELRQAGEAVLIWLKKEYAAIRATQASPSILDAVSVEAYGSKMPVNQVASILGAGPKSLVITPWDNNLAPAIDKAVRESNLGVSVSLDSQGVRISFPELTSERRTLLLKATKEKMEEARIKIRAERQRWLDDIDRKEKEGAISEDDKFRLKGELQKLVDEVNHRLEELAEKKETEILE